VGRGPGPGLEKPHHELVVEAAVQDLAGGRRNRLGKTGFEQAKPPVGLCRGALDERQRPDEFKRQPELPDGKILHRPLGLGAVVGRSRHPHHTHAVLFVTKRGLTHRNCWYELDMNKVFDKLGVGPNTQAPNRRSAFG
jgi:hypothetical protein